MQRIKIFLDLLLILSIGALSWGAYSSFNGVTLTQPGADGVYQDTYYVVGHVHTSALLLPVIPIGLVLHFALLRHSSDAVIVWGSYVSIAVGLGSLFASRWPQTFIPEGPRIYTEYPAYMANLAAANYIKIGTMGAAAVALLWQTIVALIARRRKRT